MSTTESTIAAIKLLRKNLARDYIVESCRTEREHGCASCDAAELDEMLQRFQTLYEEETVLV